VNRARGALGEMDDADYGVGMEGGIERSGDSYMAFAWMAVVNNGGRLAESRSVTLPLPHAIGDLIDAGLELGEANDRVFETHNSKQAGGAFGLLTNGVLTRESVYTDTLIVALATFSHPVYGH
jgi:non-canonical (house-cleaning) NTP pyrophosphatase